MLRFKNIVCERKYVGARLPSPCAASFQALSVNAFGDVSETNGSDHVTRNASAAHNNEA